MIVGVCRRSSFPFAPLENAALPENAWGGSWQEAQEIEFPESLLSKNNILPNSARAAE
jgi:hypothetical protein